MGTGASRNDDSLPSKNNGSVERRSRERNVRLVADVGDEPTQFLNPIGGYQNQPLLPLEEACKPLEKLLPDLRRRVWIAKKNCSHPADGLTVDESASIQLYTMEWDNSLYASLNKELRKSNRQGLHLWFPYLKLFLTALFKLPSYRGVIWRGINGDLSDQYSPVNFENIS